MANLSPPEEAPQCEDWLTTFSDAMTLLMCFFVMLASMSKIDIPSYEKVAAGIKKEIGKKESKSETQVLQETIQNTVYEMMADETVKVETDDRGIVIELQGGAFFKPGSADLRPEAYPVLEKMTQAIAAPRYRLFLIEVEGHTDDDPISTPLYPSNWELAGNRAATVVRYFISHGVDIERVKAASFAETRPKVPNRNPDGTPIPENQKENRRIVIHATPLQWEDRERLQAKIVAEEMERRRREAETRERERKEALERERLLRAVGVKPEAPEGGTAPEAHPAPAPGVRSGK